MSEQFVTITKKEYEKLKEDRRLLEALVAAGIDNWDGYDEAIAILDSEEE